MPLYRCTQCQSEFEAEKPACAACGIDPKADPRDKDVIVKLVTIHFDPPTNRPGRGQNRAACDAGIKPGSGKGQFTSEPDAVTCPRCKLSEAFIKANGASNGAAQLEIGPLPKKGRS